MRLAQIGKDGAWTTDYHAHKPLFATRVRHSVNVMMYLLIIYIQLIHTVKYNLDKQLN